MLLSNPNRKSFLLTLNLPLSRQSSSTRSSKDPASSPHKSSYSSARDGSSSSPRSPLFPASLHLKQEQPILPIPLTDGLDPSEKMKLLRKTRKLSRILGEVPIPVAIDEGLLGLLEEPSTSASASASSSSSPAQSPPGISRKSSLKRSATVGHNRLGEQTEIQRARSLASLRSSLTIPAAALTTRPPPISPVDVSWSERPLPLPMQAAISPVTPSGDAVERQFSKRNSVASSRRNSTTSSILFAERTPEQIQRARAAKLARHLGESVPPDVLLRASSPPPPRDRLASPSLVSFAEVSMELDHHRPVRRSTSTKRAKRDRPDTKRRLSLDVRTFGRPQESKVDSEIFSEPTKHRVLLKKSQSATGRLRPHTAGAVEVSKRPLVTDDSDLDDDFARPPTSERQRAMNVRRARKMAQMFGNDPPPALFQITHLHPTATGGSNPDALGIVDRRRCDSHATLVSVTGSPSSVLEPDESRRHSTTSSGGNLSPLIFANPGSMPPTPLPEAQTGEDAEVELLPYLNSDCESISDLRPASPLMLPPLANPLTCPSQQSISVASTISIPTSQVPSQHSQAPLTPPVLDPFRNGSPIPFTNMFYWHSGAASAPTSPPMPTLPPPAPLPLVPSRLEAESEAFLSDPSFRTRRIRAAKLSRFFGVGLQDITSALGGNVGSTTESIAMPSSVTPSAPRSTSTSNSAPKSAVPLVPEVSPLEMPKSQSVETFPPPSPPASSRPFATDSSTGEPEENSSSSSGRSRKRTSSSGHRNHSTTQSSHKSRVHQAQALPNQSVAAANGGDRNRSNSEPEVPSPQVHGRTFSTTVEIASEPKSKYFFLENRRSGRVTKELEMHAAIKQLRKIK